ncbi:MOV10-like RNA helicase [Skeletonema marinoi]|uniref:MOV10-like RNA helicase n=1 Tax=Skeletonema marinoi TaxID=267567 RepID=A0AAD8XWT2_9STRA|nr:MOV10-like RNA helicase [Skeletonema marinoi]KAK1734952.1 MOV10-like RNA helicase [Skeletonema marinoi]
MMQFELFVLFQDWEGALPCLTEAPDTRNRYLAMHASARGMFLEALVYLKTSSHASSWLARRKKKMKAIKTLRKLNGLVEQGNDDVRHYMHILMAECYVLEKNVSAAENNFKAAISIAELHGFLHDKALAHELACAWYKALGKDDWANFHFESSQKLYTEWGATSKGTGKTVTLVESILQTISARGSDPNAKILICAPSNTATDVVVERLAPYVSTREMIRIMAFSREKRAVPDSVMSYTNYDEETDSFVMPEVEDLMNYKIVAVTISYGGRLFNNGIQNHFTHVFMDEAGHEIEASAIGCLASVTKYSHSSPPVIVLAGDPQQLGPIIRSDIGKKFGLEKSLLERCSERECYSRSEECDDLGYHYDKRMVTKLVRNYRSHPRILQLPNEAFYNGDLIAAADITRSHRFVNWEHLLPWM